MDVLSAFAAEVVSQAQTGLYEGLCNIDSELVAAGWPPISPVWADTLRAFWGSGRRRLVVRFGRRGGKSSTLCRVAVAEMLYGKHAVPPGDVGVMMILSVKLSDAMERIATISQILDVLGVDYDRTGCVIKLRVRGAPRSFKAMAANFRTVVGGTAIGILADEMARWRDDRTGANPAAEVMRSVRPSMATMPNAHEYDSSSAFSTLDYHHELFSMGDTDAQMVRMAETWVANPTLTKADTQALEPDEETWHREYACIPMGAGELSFFDPRQIDGAIGETTKPSPGDRLSAGADFGFASDWSALYVAAQRGDDERSHFHFVDQLVLKPTPEHALRPSETVATFADVLRRYSVPGLMADAHYRESIVEHLVAHRLEFISAPTDVPATYTRLRALLHQGRVTLPDDAELIKALKQVTGQPTATGRVSIKLPRGRGGGHADNVAALVLACWQRGGWRVPADTKDTILDQQEAAEIAHLVRQVKGQDEHDYRSDDDGW